MDTLVEDQLRQEVQEPQGVRRPQAGNSEQPKVRKDYVRNACGTSFVVVGIRVKADDILRFRSLVPTFYVEGFCVLDDCEDGVPSGYRIVGKDLVDGFGELEFRQIPLEKILKIADEVKNAVGLRGEVALFTGTRTS